MCDSELERLRRDIDQLNRELLLTLNRRAQVAERIRLLKASLSMPIFDPEREEEMLNDLLQQNPGPFDHQAIRQVFRAIFRASAEFMQQTKQARRVVGRAQHPQDGLVKVGDLVFGADPILIAGPCAVESEEQLDKVAAHLHRHGVRALRAGAFKPRSSPYSFQGLGAEGLRLLQAAARRYDMVSFSEVTDPRHIELVAQHVDVLQVGARNMANYELLKELGATRLPVLLKRGMAATLDEFLWAAEYLASQGNESIILCERGVRGFGTDTRFTLDISAIPLLRQQSYLPVIVDVSHAAGRRDILAALARAALAAGAQGVMVEVHPDPANARSDAAQQLDLAQFTSFVEATGLPRADAQARRSANTYTNCSE